MVHGSTSFLKPRRRAAEFVELHAHSNCSLLDGVPSPQQIAARAAELGMPALALTDHDGLYGAVFFAQAAQEVGIKPILGAEMTLQDESHLTLLVKTKKGYANLCRLITQARRGREKGISRLDNDVLLSHSEGLIVLSGCQRGMIPRLLRAGQFEAALRTAREYKAILGRDCFWIELQRHFHQGENRTVVDSLLLADRAGLGVVATGNAHYLYPEQRQIHDVLTCIRSHTTLDAAGDQLRSNSEYTLRSAKEMAALFGHLPEALENSVRLAERCISANACLPSGTQTLPRFPTPDGSQASVYLSFLCQEALHARYPIDPPRDLLTRELSIIDQAGLADYFLIVWDIIRFARQAGIRCQGRGSAANSLVAHLLGITPIDPVACDLVFERFLSPERSVAPDIDIDFAGDRREEVIQYIYERYGKEHAAMACTLVTYRARSAIRDTARALGFPPPLVERLPHTLDTQDTDAIKTARSLVEAFGKESSERSFQHMVRIAAKLEGSPRHLGIHNGGMILSGPPLHEIVPLEPATMPGRIVTQWDKDGLESCGMVKIDILGLRMLSAVEEAVTLIEATTGQRPHLDALNTDDPEVYDMLCAGETIGLNIDRAASWTW